MIKLPVEDRFKIDLAKPVFTLDVNLVAIRPPSQRPLEYRHLASIEYNYFETGLAEVAVTPETAFEITKGVPDAELGWQAYQRVQKSRWFKGRPSSSTLSLDAQESNELWLDMRWKLWPTVSDQVLTPNQRGDVSQLFFHSVSSGSTAANSVLVTEDHNFLEKADLLYGSYGVQAMNQSEAWMSYEPRYSLITPSSQEVDELWQRQTELFNRIRSDSD